MTYRDAAEHAEQAARAAQTAKINYNDHADRKFAEAVHELSLAVKELSEQLHRDS